MRVSHTAVHGVVELLVGSIQTWIHNLVAAGIVG